MRPRAILFAAGAGLLGAAVLASGATGSPRAPLAPISEAEWRPQPGDIILTAADDLLGSQIRAASGREGIYSHIGLVVVRDGRPVVVEATPFGSGTVAMKQISAFTADPDLTEVLVLRPQSVLDTDRLNQGAARLAADRVPFDYDFETEDASALYCVELVYNLLREAGADLTGIDPVPMWVPLKGEQPVIPPHAFARAPQFAEIARRVRAAD